MKYSYALEFFHSINFVSDNINVKTVKVMLDKIELLL